MIFKSLALFTFLLSCNFLIAQDDGSTVIQNFTISDCVSLACEDNIIVESGGSDLFFSYVDCNCQTTSVYVPAGKAYVLKALAGSISVKGGSFLRSGVQSSPVSNTFYESALNQLIENTEGNIINTIETQSQTICINEQPETITGQDGVFFDFDISYGWLKSIDNQNFAYINGANQKDYTPNLLNETTYYKRQVYTAVSTGTFSEIHQVNVFSCTSTDTIPPVISIIGSSTINLTIGDTFTDPGATATDDVDGDITSSIIVDGLDALYVVLASGESSMGIPLVITYSVTDTAGNTTVVIRTIILNTFEVTLTSDKTNDTICEGDSVVFLATASLNDAAVEYEFSINGVLMTSLSASNVFTTASDQIIDGDIVGVMAIYDGDIFSSHSILMSVIVESCEPDTITLISGFLNQSVCLGGGTIGDVVLEFDGGATGATASGLPSGILASLNANQIIISGEPTESINESTSYLYTITTTGGTTSASMQGVFTVHPPSQITRTSGDANIVVNSRTDDQEDQLTNTSFSLSFQIANSVAANVTWDDDSITHSTNVSFDGNSGVLTISGNPGATGTTTHPAFKTYNYTITTIGNTYGCDETSISGSIELVDGYVPAETYTISVTASSASDYTLSGSDRNGNVTGNDPSVTIKVGDTIDFAVDASGHPFYLKTVQGTGTSDLVSGVTNNGATNGTVTWTPTTAGTYYYQCSVHNGMYGIITVQ